MQQYLYRIQPTRPGMLTEGLTEHESAVVADHFEYLQELVAEGVVLMAGRTTNADEHAFGIVILVASTQGHAAELVRNDPAVKHGIMRAELFPFRLALWSRENPEYAARGGER